MSIKIILSLFTVIGLCGYVCALSSEVQLQQSDVDMGEQSDETPIALIDKIRSSLKHDLEEQDFSIAFDYPEVLDKIPRDARILSCEKKGNNRVHIYIKGMQKPLSAKIEFWTRVPVLNKPLSPHHVIEHSDITFLRFPLQHLQGAYALRMDDLLGKQASHKPIIPMQPILLKDMRAPIIVKRENLLKLTYHVGNLHLSTMGKATRDAALGESISFETGKAKKKRIEARIIAPDQAIIQH